jgi:hypothetical protein
VGRGEVVDPNGTPREPDPKYDDMLKFLCLVRLVLLLPGLTRRWVRMDRLT